MLNNNYYTLIFFVLFSFFAHGQNLRYTENRDTLYVYETVIVYDTVYIFDTIKISDNFLPAKIDGKRLEINILQFDIESQQANLLRISRDQTATIPLNGIILTDNNKKIESMKKLSFLGVVLFAFQSMVIAQTNYGISAGVGTWWATSNHPNASVGFSPTFNAGFFIKQPLGKAVFLQLDANYTFLNNNSSYKVAVENPVWGTIGDGESASDYHQITVPLEVGYKIGKFSPLLGIEYSYRFSEPWLKRQIHSFGFIGGVNYSINDKFSIGLNYYQALTKDISIEEEVLDPISLQAIGAYNYYWRSSSIGLTLYYALNNKKVEKAEVQ